MHRRRAAARGLTRLEVQTPRRDANLIRALAAALRSGSKEADAVRSTLTDALFRHDVQTAFDIFGSDLSDEVFAGVFEQPRQRRWREIEL